MRSNELNRRIHSALCSVALGALVACGDSGGDSNAGPTGQNDPAQTGGTQGGTLPGADGAVATPGGGGAPGSSESGLDAGAGVGATDAASLQVIDTGPPDLGEDSEGDRFYRADTLVLKSPNMYVTVFLLGKTLATSDAQNALNDSLTKDGDGNGFVDLSLMLRFLDTIDPPTTAMGQLTPGGALCPLPLAYDSACGPEETFPFQRPPVMFTNQTQACALGGTQESAPPPCFITTPASLTMQLPILGAVPLQDGQVIGTWDGGNITGGFVRGFLPKSIAQATKLGDGLPSWLELAGVKAGAPLTDFLDDSEAGTNNQGEVGWWFLMTFTAKQASFNPTGAGASAADAGAADTGEAGASTAGDAGA